MDILFAGKAKIEMRNENKKAMFCWERWRIGYNLILLAEGSWLLREHLAPAFSRFWLLMVLFAIGANICYTLGFLLELCASTLLRMLPDRTRYQSILTALRYFLFWVGLGFSMWWVWMWSLRGLGHLGGSVYYVYKDEFQDKTLAFISFFMMANALFLAAIGLFWLFTRASRNQSPKSIV